MFIGRKYELDKLNRLYDSDRFEFAVIYGRRRVGKSTLIKEFCKDKKSIYYMGMEAASQSNIDSLSAAIWDFEGRKLPAPSYGSYEALFDYIDTISDERIILAIDEYPYLAEDYPALSSLLQKHIDMKWNDSKLMLILCGSSMSFMENQVLGYKSPLYGRRTAQFRMEAFRYYELKEFGWNYTEEELALIYGITGGIAEYVSFINGNCSVKENILNMYLDQAGRMFEEPTNLMKQELREPRMYHTILGSIASGSSTLNEIAGKARESTASCSYHLNALQALDIVKKETPAGEKESSRKTIYRIKDSAFRFWYRFVFPYQTFIVNENGEYVYENFVKPFLSSFMGTVFEDMCLSYLMHPNTLQKIPFPYSVAGRWWGNNPSEKRQEEIDICALGADAVLLCECKWRNEPVKLPVLENLQRQGGLFPQNQKYFWLFSKSNFSDSVKEANRLCSDIRCITLAEMYKIDWWN